MTAALPVVAQEVCGGFGSVDHAAAAARTPTGGLEVGGLGNKTRTLTVCAEVRDRGSASAATLSQGTISSDEIILFTPRPCGWRSLKVCLLTVTLSNDAATKCGKTKMH